MRIYKKKIEKTQDALFFVFRAVSLLCTCMHSTLDVRDSAFVAASDLAHTHTASPRRAARSKLTPRTSPRIPYVLHLCIVQQTTDRQNLPMWVLFIGTACTVTDSSHLQENEGNEGIRNSRLGRMTDGQTVGSLQN